MFCLAEKKTAIGVVQGNIDEAGELVNTNNVHIHLHVHVHNLYRLCMYM